MPFEYYISKGSKKLRCGYTTGSCAALAAKAAVKMLLGGNAIDTVSITTPKGIDVSVQLYDVQITEAAVSCAVQKDAGDDADVTDGVLVYASVSKTKGDDIVIDGGIGVGRVTRKGLEQPVGSAAINRVPREMIKNEAVAVCKEYEYYGGLNIVISIPDGVRLAKSTFNPNLGIEGGISVLGTSGIVEPQSLQALVDSIEVEMKMLAANGIKNIIATPGNYGESFIKKYPLLTKIPYVKCSNFIGDTLDFASAMNFSNVIIVGHIGKLIKLAGGVMNTHSLYADCRAEIIAAHAAINGADCQTIAAIMSSATTDECIEILDNAKLRKRVFASIMSKIQQHISRRAGACVTVGAVAFSNQFGLLGETENALKIIKELEKNE
ncbi:MAG TPA: cobalamin biosynthesis protein CbiD [Ruminococcaceae bacterium]|nr:cobalamin biosynthesis protein CbiD [Oscillospiraceae bacterium]